MKTRSVEFLLFAAFVTSATVVQIREEVRHPVPQEAEQAGACSLPHRDIAPAGCEETHGGPPNVRVPSQQRSPRIWV